MIKVAKFGGSSLSSAERIKNVCELIRADGDIKVVVISAMGASSEYSVKLTDSLYACLTEKKGVFDQNVILRAEERILKTAKQLGVQLNIEDSFLSLIPKGQDEDYLISRGEYYTALIVAKYLNADFMDASDVIEFSYDGSLNLAKTVQNFKSQYNGRLTVVPGFYGGYPNARIKLFPRGGGDVSGAIVSVALKADEYQNFTDVNGVLSCDPRLVGHAKEINAISYKDLSLLSSLGASVIHEDAVRLASAARIPTRIRSTFCPEALGTIITNDLIGQPTAIAATQIYSLSVRSSSHMSKTKVAAELISKIKASKGAVLHLSSTADGVEIFFNAPHIKLNELKDYPDAVIGELSAVSVVCSDNFMQALSSSLAALTKENIPVHFILTCRASGYFTLGVSNVHKKSAAEQIYKAIIV